MKNKILYILIIFNLFLSVFFLFSDKLITTITWSGFGAIATFFSAIVMMYTAFLMYQANQTASLSVKEMQKQYEQSIFHKYEDEFNLHFPIKDRNILVKASEIGHRIGYDTTEHMKSHVYNRDKVYKLREKCRRSLELLEENKMKLHKYSPYRILIEQFLHNISNIEIFFINELWLNVKPDIEEIYIYHYIECVDNYYGSYEKLYHILVTYDKQEVDDLINDLIILNKELYKYFNLLPKKSDKDFRKDDILKQIYNNNNYEINSSNN